MDQSYSEASVEAMGRNIAQMYKGMVENGMSREEALEVVKVWVQALALRGASDA